MATGNNAREAAEEQQRREQLRRLLHSALDNNETPMTSIYASSAEREDAVEAAGYGAVGILGEL